MKQYLIAPSILSADFARLGEYRVPLSVYYDSGFDSDALGTG